MRTALNLRPVQVTFVVDNVALEDIFRRGFQFSPVSITPSVLRAFQPSTINTCLKQMILFVLITNLTHFCNVFISLLYMFRATQCSSSGESIVSIHHMAYITLCRWPSGLQVREELSTRWCTDTIDSLGRVLCRSERNSVPDDVLIQLILLMMSTGLLETCREVK